jgi:hypothetical protein
MPVRELRREAAALERTLPELLATHAGEYVAVHAGRVIDHDADEFALARRVEREHRSNSVLIRKVSQDCPQEDRLESPEAEGR